MTDATTPATDEQIAAMEAIARTDLDNPVSSFVLPLIARIHQEREKAGWQPIETAPKDKTPVLIAVPTKDKDDFHVGEGYFNPDHGGDWWWAGTDYGDYHGGPISEINYHGPSHWQLLPTPPALSQEERT